MAEDLAWGEETPREIKKLMRATGSSYFFKSEVSVLWRDLCTKYLRLKRKGRTHIKQ